MAELDPVVSSAVSDQVLLMLGQPVNHLEKIADDFMQFFSFTGWLIISYQIYYKSYFTVRSLNILPGHCLKILLVSKQYCDNRAIVRGEGGECSGTNHPIYGEEPSSRALTMKKIIDSWIAPFLSASISPPRASNFYPKPEKSPVPSTVEDFAGILTQPHSHGGFASHIYTVDNEV